MGKKCKYRRDKDSGLRQRAGRRQRSFQMLEPRIMLAADLPVDLLTGPDDPIAQVAQVETVAPADQPIRNLPAPTATDADAADTLTYSTTGGADQALFAIAPSTGALTFNTAPDYEVPTDQGTDNQYEVTVQVTDGTNTDTQAITVTDDRRPAVADVGVDRVVIPGANVILDGSESSGDISAYQWEQLGQPVVELTGHDTATASFTAPLNTTGQNFDLIFELTVADPTGLVDTAVVLITVEPHLPAQLIGNVVATRTVTIASGQTLDLGCFNLAAPSVVIEAGGLLTGSGSVAAPVSGVGEITLVGGNMSLGDLNAASGFNFDGTLKLNGNTAVLLDANVAKLGAVTDLGSGGTLVAANGMELASGHSLTGSGTIDSDLVHQGTIIIAENQTVIIRGNLSGVGGTDSSGVLVITANYTPGNSPAAIDFGGDLAFGPSAHLVLEIDGSQPGSGYDQLNIAGQLTAGGTLEMVLGQNYEPVGDESFDLLNFESFSGALSEPNFTGMPLPEGLQWNTTALTTEGVLSVESTAPPLAGDYDESGTVDIDDYALWKSTFGSTTQLAADGNDNGVIDAGDYTIYRDNLGQSSGMAVATSSSAEGEPVIVNTTVDENDGIDAGGISLRDAVAHAATHTDPLDILFANALGGQTITLDSALGDLQINSNLVIDGEGKNISISGGDATSIFKITGGNVTIKNLTLPTVVIESGSTLRLGGSVVGDLINNGTLAVASDDTYTPNPDLNETPGGMLNAALSNRNPDCRTYALDANDGDYSSVGADDRSNFDEDAPYYPGTDVASTVHIDLVIVGGDYIQDPDNPTIPGGWDYETVTPTSDPEAATHCRMVHNMIPNHDFGRDVGARTEPDVWVTEIDHDDRQVTYLPVHPRMSEPRVADDTDRNPTNFMDYDGVLLNGIGIAMDSGFCYHPAHPRANAAGNATGCGGRSVWYEIPAYTLQEPHAEHMAALFDDYFGHGFEGSYHYHAITHPLQKDDDQATSPSSNGSPLIGFAKDGFPIYGHWFVNPQGELVKARSGYVLKTYELNDGESRDPVVGLPPNFDRGTPPTPWDIVNRPEDFDSDFGVPLGRYLDDWVYDDGNTGNLDECNGATDINGVYGYYITDTYPYSPICTFGVHEPSFGKVPPLRWHDETTENTHDDHGHKINGH